MTERDDRELEQYLQGGSPLSRRYRAASRESAPPALDELVLAQARAHARRAPRASRWLASLALAASLVLGVNLAWNVWQAEPVPPVVPQRADAPVAEARKEEKAVAEAPRDAAAPAPSATAPEARRAREQQAREAQEAAARRRVEDEDRSAQASAEASAPPSMATAGAAPPAPLTEPEKIERLIAYVAGLEDVQFIRNGEAHSAADAADHMRLKLGKAGKRVKTADDFIRYCASQSSMTGEPYLIRYPDGTTRTAEEVLRAQLATMP